MTATLASARDAAKNFWTIVRQSLARPYPVTVSMVVLVSLVPVYLYISNHVQGGTLHVPELALDRAIPLTPGWVFVYGPLYLFLIVLPVFAVREADHLRRTVNAYLMVWLVAYACFLAYPTIGPRPATVVGDGFAAWGVRALYGMDPPHNCLPSLHVAHSFVSAFTCFRLHRRLGILALVSAALVGVSTLFIKQHYVLDVVTGALLAFAAYLVFLRAYPRARVPEADRRAAPVLAGAVVGVVALAYVCYLAIWLATT